MKRLAALLGLISLGGAFVPGLRGPLFALACALLAALLTEPAAVRRAWGGRSAILVVTAAALAAAVVTWSAGWRRGTVLGLIVAIRLIVLALLATLAARHIDADALEHAAVRLGLGRLTLVFGLALNTLPHLGEAWRDTWIALATRTRRRSPRLRDLPRLVEVLLAHTARIAEDAAGAAALRGHRALTTRPLALAAPPLVVLVTGRSGRGKTPALARAIETLRNAGCPVSGFIQPAIVEDGRKVGFACLDVGTGEQATLARWVGQEAGEHATPYVFEPAGFALASRALRRAPRGALLFADEVGPVELRGGGHMPALHRALRRSRPRAIVVGVRRAVIGSLAPLFTASPVVTVDVEVEPDPVGALLGALELVDENGATASADRGGGARGRP